MAYTEEIIETKSDMLIRLSNNKKYRESKALAAKKIILKTNVKALKTQVKDLEKEVNYLLSNSKMIRLATDFTDKMSYIDFVKSVSAMVFGATVDELGLNTRREECVNARCYVYYKLRSIDSTITDGRLGGLFNGEPYNRSIIHRNLTRHKNYLDTDTLYVLKCERADKIIGKFLTR